MPKPVLCCSKPKLQMEWLVGIAEHGPILRLQEVFCAACKTFYRFDDDEGQVRLFRDADKMAVEISIRRGRAQYVQQEKRHENPNSEGVSRRTAAAPGTFRSRREVRERSTESAEEYVRAAPSATRSTKKRETMTVRDFINIVKDREDLLDLALGHSPWDGRIHPVEGDQIYIDTTASGIRCLCVSGGGIPIRLTPDQVVTWGEEAFQSGLRQIKL